MAVILRDYEREQKNLYITWQAIDHDLRRFVRDCREEDLIFSGIFTYALGGMPPAVFLSKHLSIPLLLHVHDDRVLIFDDIVDSGSTIAPYYGKNYIFALWFNPRRSKVVIPNKWYHEKPEGYYLVFPWEPDGLYAVR